MSSLSARSEASVLLIDDDVITVMVSTALLEQEGYVVTDVGSVAAARVHLEAHPKKHSIVLLDLHLSDGISLPLVPVIRCTQPDAKVVLVSGDVVKHAEYPVDGYFAKGEDASQLLVLMGQLLAPTQPST